MSQGFENMGDTGPARNSSFIKPGRYLCRIEHYLHNVVTRKGRTNSNFKLLICAVFDDSAAANVEGGAHRIGDKVTWMLMADVDASGPSLKAAMMAATEVESDQLDDEAFKKLGSAAQPLNGIFIEIDAHNVLTKKDAVFTVVTFKRRIQEEEVKQLVPEAVRTSLHIGGK